MTSNTKRPTRTRTNAKAVAHRPSPRSNPSADLLLSGGVAAKSVILKAALSFGLVTIGVRIVAATGDHRTHRTRQLHAECGSPLNQRLFCPLHEVLVDPAQVVNGIEVGTDEFVLITAEELADLPVPSRRTLALVQFVDADQARGWTRFGGKTYYLEPEPNARLPYALLRDALADLHLVAFATVTLRQREQPVAIEPRGTLLIVTTLAWPDEIRNPHALDLPEPGAGTAAQRRLARQLLVALRGPVDPSAFRDAYAAALDDLVSAKLAGSKPHGVAAQPALSGLPDLMAALEAAVAEARQRRPSPRKRSA